MRMCILQIKQIRKLRKHAWKKLNRSEMIEKRNSVSWLWRWGEGSFISFYFGYLHETVFCLLAWWILREFSFSFNFRERQKRHKMRDGDDSDSDLEDRSQWSSDDSDSQSDKSSPIRSSRRSQSQSPDRNRAPESKQNKWFVSFNDKCQNKFLKYQINF